MKGIQNIIFDLGNVLIDLDIDATEQRFRAMLGAYFDVSFHQNKQSGVFEAFEIGTIDEKTFVETLQTSALQPISYQEIIDAWNAMLLGIAPARFNMLARLRQKYRIFLLSNTNETHLRWVYNYLETSHGITDWDERFFEQSFYSHLINKRKPNADIYEYVLAQINASPANTLFIDDNAANIASANALGIQTIHHADGRDITTVMETF